MRKIVRVPEMLSNKQLKKLSKASKALRNRRIRHLLECFSTENIISRKHLKKCVDVSEGTLSGYLSLLEERFLVNLLKAGRQVNVQITPFGRRLAVSYKDLENFTDVASDGNRVRIMELLTSNGGGTFTKIYYDLNLILARKRQSEMTTALLSYHLRILKKKKIVVTDGSLYSITLEGTRILQAAANLFS